MRTWICCEEATSCHSARRAALGLRGAAAGRFRLRWYLAAFLALGLVGGLDRTLAGAGAGPAGAEVDIAAEIAPPRGGHAVVSLNAAARAQLAAATGTVRVHDFALADGERVTLELERFHVTKPQTQFVIGQLGGPDMPLDYDPRRVVLLRGQVAGHPQSRVFLGLSPTTSTGYIDLGGSGAVQRIASQISESESLDAGQLVIFPARGAAGGLAVPACGLETAGVGAPLQLDGLPPMKGLQQIELAVETDYEYFVLFGDLPAAGDYVTLMYAQVSDIYMRDVNARVDISFVRLWDDPNDLFNQPDPLGPFRSYWNQNMGHVHRDVAQFFSGRTNLPYGGIAYLNGLCNSASYSVSGYALGFFADPSRPHVYNRDMSVTAHELGHNCSAPHTHDIGLDECDDENSQPQRGTIMSYCGQTFTGGEANMDLRFHTTIQAIMMDYIRDRGCIADDCNQNGIDDVMDIATGTSPDVNGNGIPDECEDCNGNGVLDPQDILAGTSRDVNGNTIPDECEPDCNSNQRPDTWDIALGSSQDLNNNNVPDECEPDCDANGQLDYAQIQADMSLDLNRNARLDACEDCDNDGTTDLVELDHAHNIWIASLDHTTIREYLAQVGTLTAVSDQANLVEPQDLLITSDRRILVSSGSDSRVVEFDEAGQLVGSLVAAGAGGLSRPTGLLWRESGHLLVASANTDAVLEYDGQTGAYLGAFIAAGAGGLSGPFGLAIGPNGNLFVTSATNEVLEYDGQTGAFVGVFVSAATNGGLQEPRGLLFLPESGNLLVASHGTDQVLEYDGATGEYTRQFNINGTATVLTLDQPWALRIGPEGDVYVSRTHDRREEFTPAAGAAPLHLTNARVYQFDPRTGFMVRAYILGVNSGIQHPTGFDFMPDQGTDCNFNQIPDACDIASGYSADVNRNGVPDECERGTGDMNCDGLLDNEDIDPFVLAVVGGPAAYAAQWPNCEYFNADVNQDGLVDNEDIDPFVALLTGP